MFTKDQTKPSDVGGNTKVIRALDFAKRLETACEGHPHCPTEQYRGKQKWVYEGLEEKFNVIVSPEAVRKWVNQLPQF